MVMKRYANLYVPVTHPDEYPEGTSMYVEILPDPSEDDTVGYHVIFISIIDYVDIAVLTFFRNGKEEAYSMDVVADMYATTKKSVLATKLDELAEL